jgi:uncharacterized protein YyaL (SSP411 family)
MTAALGSGRNSLAGATSPYLTQHATNPVHWYVWGEEALKAAIETDRPILLSIGYSSCHWCHVMAHESFEDEVVARRMNELFVNIKVDREERPDIDAIYMNYVQMTTGAGGWPLTVFLTPNQVPFFGGTYFPPTDHYGRPSFIRVLDSVATAYRDRREELQKISPEVVLKLQQSVDFDVPMDSLKLETLDNATRTLSNNYDSLNGGFGSAPKFPSSMALGFLLRDYHRTGTQDTLEMVESSLGKMANGGIFDQVGGGFHRYSVDEKWLVPHFEKMLYDNALLVRGYLEAMQITGKTIYREAVEKTLGFVEREMLHSGGGFFSALDADSEGVEGLFYVWSKKEVESVLGSFGGVFCDYMGVSSLGNFEGDNILNKRMELDEIASVLGLPAAETRNKMNEALNELLKVREQRVRPGLDDKVLASWNGLMVTAFVHAAFVLGSEEYLQVALRAGDFLSCSMIDQGRVFRTWRDGKASLNGYLDDYAALAEAFLWLFEISGDRRWLIQARELVESSLELFWDEEEGDFFFTSKDHENLIVRHKEHMDNATPSGNAISCLNLLRLSRLLGEQKYWDRGCAMLERKSVAMSRHPLAFSYWLQAFDFAMAQPLEVVAFGHKGLDDPVLATLRETYLPSKVVVLTTANSVKAEDPMVPLLDSKHSINGETTVYVCREFTCKKPVTNAVDLATELKS